MHGSEREQPSGRPLSRKELFRSVKQTREFTSLYSELRKFMLVPSTEEQMEEIQDRFAGALFEQVARLQIQSEFPDPDQVFFTTPIETAFFYHKILGGTIRKHPFNNFGLLGQSIPDSIVFPKRGPDKNKAIAVYEFTLVGNSAKFEKKIAAMIENRRKFPQIFAASQYIFVTPEMNNPPAILRQYDLVDWVKHKQLPFNHLQFNDFIHGLIHSYDDTIYKDAGYLVDIQDRIRFETERAWQHLISGEELTWAELGLIQSAIDNNVPFRMYGLGQSSSPRV